MINHHPLPNSVWYILLPLVRSLVSRAGRGSILLGQPWTPCQSMDSFFKDPVVVLLVIIDCETKDTSSIIYLKILSLSTLLYSLVVDLLIGLSSKGPLRLIRMNTWKSSRTSDSLSTYSRSTRSFESIRSPRMYVRTLARIHLPSWVGLIPSPRVLLCACAYATPTTHSFDPPPAPFSSSSTRTLDPARPSSHPELLSLAPGHREGVPDQGVDQVTI